MDLTLDPSRAKTARAIASLQWLHVPLVAALSAFRGVSPVFLTLAVVLLADLVKISAVRRPSAATGHISLAFAYAGVAAILAGLMQGHPWQADMRMYFFCRPRHHSCTVQLACHRGVCRRASSGAELRCHQICVWR